MTSRLLCSAASRHPGSAPAAPIVIRPRIHERQQQQQQQQQQVPLAAHHERVREYLATLNEEQQAAVYCSTSAVRVKAGPGSGKTRVVTARVARLLSEGVPASSVLVITFTNKAADELKERLKGVLGGQAAEVSAGTFHSICARILRSFIKQLPPLRVPHGEPPLDAWDDNFTVLDTDDSLRVMRIALQTVLNVDSSAKQETTLAKTLMEIYSNIRSEALTVHHNFDIKACKQFDFEEIRQSVAPLREADVVDCFQEYTRVCAENNAVDFDDLLGLTVALLQQVPSVRQMLQDAWRHVLVDEFQDTNSAQYELVRLLRGPEGSGCTTFVVGDSDQAIYSWRGANPDNMDKQFMGHFPTCATLFLSCNYRSGYGIVHAAEAVLSHNGLPPLHQQAVPMKKAKGHVEHMLAYSDWHEASMVTDRIRSKVEGGVMYKDIAVLYRTRMQSRQFEEKLIQAGIPFRVLGDKPFWTRSEVKVMTSYLRVTANPGTDSMALEQIINVPSRKIGASAIKTLREGAEERNLTFAALVTGDLRSLPPLPLSVLDPLLMQLGAAQGLPDSALKITPSMPVDLGKKLNKTVRAGLHQLRTTILLARSTAFHKGVSAAVQVLGKASGFIDDLAGDNDKLESLEVLRTAAASPSNWLVKEETLLRPPSSVTDNMAQLQLFLQHIALMREIDELKEKDLEGNRVTLMTVHAAKGLEYHSVFFVGFEDGLVPLVRQRDDALPPHLRDKLLAEEKRLAYVGCTRAMERLYIVSSQTRMAFTSKGPPAPRPTTTSRFLAEIRHRVPGLLVRSGMGQGS